MAKRLYMPALAALLGAALIGLLVYGLSTQAASRTLDEAIAHHDRPLAPAAQTSLPLLVGTGKTSLASYRGRVVVLNFWASWCEPCKAEAPRLERVQRALAAHDGTVLGVAYLDAEPDSRDFVRELKLTYPNLRDTTGEFVHAYGTDQLPETFVIDRSGHVASISRGEVKEAFLDRAVSLAESS